MREGGREGGGSKQSVENDPSSSLFVRAPSPVRAGRGVARAQVKETSCDKLAHAGAKIVAASPSGTERSMISGALRMSTKRLKLIGTIIELP